MSAQADTSSHETTTAIAPPAETAPEAPAPADPASVDLAPASARAGAERDAEPTQGEEAKPVMDLARMAWLATVLACLVAVGVLILQGYFGYAGVTFAVAVSAATNLF